MDKIQKLLAALPRKDRARIEHAVEEIAARQWRHLDIKKLSSREGWRVRIGNFRIKFYVQSDGRAIIYDIQRRGDHTYGKK
ncbi:MAG: hypothetical protein AAB588_01955 [Patescibacteria group bacterium]